MSSIATGRESRPAISDAVTNDDKAVGDWSVVERYDGTRQWAYQGHPVYLHYHDSPDKPLGNGVDGAWHFLQP